jgi:DNA-binding PadR family transcriptional regulator
LQNITVDRGEDVSKGAHLGEFEHLVLLALLRLKDDAYGVTVRQEIQRRAGRRVAIGAVYACLERLERKGYVTAQVSDPQPVPGGRSRKYFVLTSEGGAALRRAREMMDRMTEGIHVDAELEAL